jgi:DNA-binding transcriptional LysR family regulator
MLKIDCIAAFVAVAQAGSISEAARRLQMSKSVISERLAELERDLGATLLHRTTRKLTITEDGAAFLERAVRIVQEVADASAEMSERRNTLAGPLRIAGPVGFGSLHLGPALYRFLKEHPTIDLTLDLDDRFVSVAADGYDAVVRNAPITDERFIVKQLAPSRRILVASPDYLNQNGRPDSLADLEKHRAIIYGNRGTADWRFETSEGGKILRPSNALHVNNCIVMHDAAVAGIGMALLPTFVVYKALARGELLAVDVQAEAESATVYIAYPRDRRVSAKVRALTEYLRRTFGDPPYWDSEKPEFAAEEASTATSGSIQRRTAAGR